MCVPISPPSYKQDGSIGLKPRAFPPSIDVREEHFSERHTTDLRKSPAVSEGVLLPSNELALMHVLVIGASTHTDRRPDRLLPAAWPAPTAFDENTSAMLVRACRTCGSVALPLSSGHLVSSSRLEGRVSAALDTRGEIDRRPPVELCEHQDERALKEGGISFSALAVDALLLLDRSKVAALSSAEVEKSGPRTRVHTETAAARAVSSLIASEQSTRRQFAHSLSDCSSNPVHCLQQLVDSEILPDSQPATPMFYSVSDAYSCSTDGCAQPRKGLVSETPSESRISTLVYGIYYCPTDHPAALTFLGIFDAYCPTGGYFQ